MSHDDDFGGDGFHKDEVRCVCCGHTTAFESCGFCGNALCPACFEMCGGFCDGPHTQEQIDAYAREVYGETKRSQDVRNELREKGIL